MDPATRLEASAAKIAAPFSIDPTLCFYSPQDNVDAFDHPRVAAHLDWVRLRWQPPAERPRVALLLPCTASKPYPVSPEHREINAALLARGWEPCGGGEPPAALRRLLAPGDSPRLFDTAPLQRSGVFLDRIVVSEPLALVPYEVLYDGNGAPSPATAYDDPGLFEWRGTSVAPWRPDCTAVAHDDGTWSWGPAEHAAYAHAHNRLVEVMAATLTRVAPAYRAIVAWLPAGLTHRSFVGDDALRRREGLPHSPPGPDGPMPLVGLAELTPGLVHLLEPAGDPAVLVHTLEGLLTDPGVPAP